MEQMFSYPIQKRYVGRVIYNAPATIVFWTDGTKTVVKCHECCYRDCCEKWRMEDGACGSPEQFDDEFAKAWKQTGVVQAMLKKTFPNYISELEKLFG